MNFNIQFCFKLWIFYSISGISTCMLDVTKDMLNSLMISKQSELSCEDLWSNILSQISSTHQNLTDCQKHEQNFQSPITNFNSCQQLVEDVKNNTFLEHENLIAKINSKLVETKQKVEKEQQKTINSQRDIENIRKEIQTFYHDLLLLNIDLGDVRQAIKYYRLFKLYQNASKLVNSLIQSAYRDKKHENKRLENLLAFVRNLASSSDKVLLYRLIQGEIMKRTTQNLSYLAMIASLDMAKVVFKKEYKEDQKLYLKMFEQILRRWRFQILSGNYKDIVDFAIRYPLYFEMVESRIPTINSKIWPQISFNQFTTYPNQLPLLKQRLEAFRIIMLQIKQRNKINFANRLSMLAKQISICETFMKNQKNDQSGQELLLKLKIQFSDFDFEKL
ncbi:uncharacterized protein LOC128729084 [Anopheles nili]|uniref:uncharacterized protein LOC128729084 n=1 Tax=Anopheles nili TaxID=185578 RepID=UPI00237B9D88|nr:uncharacterized protein LOC128729084 [Anopheles nili]